jgi:DNA repair photolyase
MICDAPISIDNYRGCTHQCKYCFAARKERELNHKKVLPISDAVNKVKRFLEGQRTKELSFIDFNIPLHWGGASDPFQPVEKKYRSSYEILKLFAKSKYPLIISTKGRLIAEQQYLELIKECNAVVQISMLCSKYDAIEAGCPSFEERLEMLKKVSKVAKRTIVRCQPYLPEIKSDVLKNIKRFADCGAYGVIFEAMRFIRKKEGLEKVAGDYVFPKERLRQDFLSLRNECHKYGLKFFSGENRLRTMGDSLCCCGFEGLEGFTPLTYNANHILLDKTGKSVVETPAMSAKGSGFQALHSCKQRAGNAIYRDITYKELVNKILLEENNLNKLLG